MTNYTIKFILILTVGTTDKDRHWHPFGIGLTFFETHDDFAFLFDAVKEASQEIANHDYDPDTLIADSAAQIHNGFESVFTSLRKRGNCWAHVIRNIDKHLKIASKELKSSMLADLVAIHASFNDKVFHQSVSLFLSKDRRLQKSDVNAFLDYMESCWFKEASWYEGYLPGLPSKSNNIESFHRNGLKDKVELMNKLPTMLLLDALLPIVRNWSLDRSSTLTDNDLGEINHDDVRSFAKTPTLSADDYIAAQQWEAKGKKIIILGARTDMELDDWIKYISSIVMIKLDKTNWKLSTCTCGAPWFKHFKCHHVIVCAYRAGLCNFTAINMQLPLERKLARGKPSKRKEALVRQSIDPPQRYTGLEYVDDHEGEEPTANQLPATSPLQPKRGRPNARKGNGRNNS